MMDVRHATISDFAAIAALLARCEETDGRAALSEFKALRVPVANGVRSLVAVDTGPVDTAAAGKASGNGGAAGGAAPIVALAVAAWHAAEIGEAGGYWAAEIALDPVTRSVEKYISVAAALETDLGEPVALWTFDATQAAAAVGLGLIEVRAIIELRRPLPADSSEFPEGLSLRSFVEGADERMWLALNQAVFAHHPEAGSIDSADLALRMAQPWFDPEGLMILMDHSLPIGYVWTKRHQGAVGEIYMIGLVSAYRGRGLARPLTLAGLEFLARRAMTTAMLYAEGSSEAAIGLYQSMGFKPQRRIALFGRPGSGPKT